MTEHTSEGISGLICGILGIVLVFFLNYIPTIIAIIAIGLGSSARKKGDVYGTYSMILGGLHFVVLIIVSALIYNYFSSLL